MQSRRFDIAEGIALTGSYLDMGFGDGPVFHGGFTLPPDDNNALVHEIVRLLIDQCADDNDGEVSIGFAVSSASPGLALMFRPHLEADVLATARRLAQS